MVIDMDYSYLEIDISVGKVEGLVNLQWLRGVTLVTLSISVADPIVGKRAA